MSALDRAGRVQRQVAEEAKRLDPTTRDVLARALWRHADRMGDECARRVGGALAAAMEEGYNAQTTENARVDFEAACDGLQAAIELLQHVTMVASAVSPPPRAGTEDEAHSP